MKKIMLLILISITLTIPVSAIEIETVAPPDVVLDHMPESTGDFGEDLWYVIKSAISSLRPDFAEASAVCLRVFSVVLLVSVLQSFRGLGKTAVQLTGIIVISLLLLNSSHSLIGLGAETVRETSQYGMLLLPVMTAALAAQGGITSSGALYAGTAIFDSILSTAISSVLIPMVYIFLALGILAAATEQDLISRLQDFVKWLLTWCLKIILYIFTGYITITGVISGSTDQTTLKAAKVTISSAVPVVGNILSDTSEALLVSIHLAKNAAGTYGILAMLAIVIGPFLTIGIHSMFLKLTAAVCGVFSNKKCSDLIGTFSAAMTFLLAMTGTECLIQLISTVCFMKGMG